MVDKLIIVSGSDRTGKTTLINHIKAYLGETHTSYHHFSAPRSSASSIFSMYEDALIGLNDNIQTAIFDRSYVCGYILEQARRNTHDHLSDVVDFELKLINSFIKVIHIGIIRPWYWSAPKILEELYQNDASASTWFIRDELIKARNEHLFYQDKLISFYQTLTIFPHLILDNPDYNSSIPDLLTEIDNILY